MTRTLGRTMGDDGATGSIKRIERSLAAIRPLFPVLQPAPYDHTAEKRAKRDPVLLDGLTAHYLLGHLLADTRPVFPEAHAEALRTLRTALS